VWANPELSLLQLLVESIEALLEPSAFNFNLEIPETQLEQLLVWQRGPGKLLSRHGNVKPDGGGTVFMVS
jgi:hypothetical protein